MSAIMSGARFVDACGIATRVYDAGSGDAILFLHGAAPGVTAETSWARPFSVLVREARVIACDLVGFGATQRPPGFTYGVSSWAAHAWAVADVLEVETVSIVGNSMGARVALAMALSQPSRVARLVLMGTRVKPSPTPASQLIMTYEPGLAAMERLIRECFVCDQTIVTDETVRRRYEASAVPGAHEAFRAAFSPQARANEPALDEAALRSVTTPSLVLHGREDRVVPAENSWDLASWLPNADLQMLGNCGHWLHMERPAWFDRTLQDFLGGAEHATPRVR